MITKSETIRPNAVDLLKVIFCIFIICLHTEFFENTIGVSSNLTGIEGVRHRKFFIKKA